MNLVPSHSLSGLRLLDVGCGYHHPQTALLQSEVKAICGLDTEKVFYRDGAWLSIRDACSERGLVRGMVEGAYRYLYHRVYYGYLSRVAGRQIRIDALNLCSYAGTVMPYPDQSFNGVISSAVLEHVKDIDLFAAECNRVLVPGGIIDMWWHNFYSISGSHATSRQPWSHLLGAEVQPHLNRKRPEEIEMAFGKQFEAVRVIPSDRLHRLAGDPSFQTEGAELLRGPLEDRLGSYCRDLLITTGFVIQARKAS